MKYDVQKIQAYLDIETTGTKPGAGIWEIGCLLINNETETTHEFSTLCRPLGDVDLDTLAWIKSKPEVEARYLRALGEDMDETDALLAFSDWVNNCGGMRNRDNETFFSWGTFDFPIAGYAMQLEAITQPWHYGSECDLRSVAKFFGSAIRPDTSKHEALEDACALREAHRKLTLRYIYGPASPH